MSSNYDHGQIADLRASGFTWDHIANEIGAPSGEAARNAHRRWRKSQAVDPLEPTGDVQTVMEERIRKGTLERYAHVIVAGKHKTEEEVLIESGLDLDEWEVVNAVFKPYEMAMKNQDNEPTVVRLTSWRITLRPKAETVAIVAPRKIILPERNAKIRDARARVKRSPTSFIWPDTHVPYHDPQAVNVALQILEELDVDDFVNLGDLLDCESISDFAKNYRPEERITLQTEIDLASELCGIHHALTPRAEGRRWLLEGNHEDRLFRQVKKIAADRVGGEILTLDKVLPVFDWAHLLGTREIGWGDTVAYGKRVVLRDRLICVHGNSVGQNPERAEYQRYEMAGVSGHTHRIGVHHKRSLHGGNQSWHGVGFLGRIRDEYTVFPNWQQGCAVVTWGPDGSPHIEQIEIHEGKAWFRGRLYVGDSKSFGDNWR